MGYLYYNAKNYIIYQFEIMEIGMRRLIYEGKEYTIKQLAEKFNDSYENFRKRLARYNFDVEKARLSKDNGLKTKKKEVNRKPKFTHGMSKTKTYKVWEMMIQRCSNPKNKAYKNYGDRGISVCDKWKTFEGFFEDVGVIPEGMQIDRIDNNGNYEASNCRLCTQSINMRNTSKSKYWYVDGIKYGSMKEASIANNVSVDTIAQWCKGRRTTWNGKEYFYPPKENCWCELKYKGDKDGETKAD